jgi:glycosyltransferase involved in cell wall biosynthesis
MGDVHVLGPYNPYLLKKILSVLHKSIQFLTGKRWNYRHSRILSERYADYFEKKISEIKPDLIVAPAASAEIARLKTTVPLIYITDGTFRICKDYHTALSGLSRFSIQESDQTELLAIQKASAVLISSEWCANSVLRDYGAISDKVFVKPFGANLPEDAPSPGVFDTAPVEWNLLFISSNWKNKGGDIALEAFRRVRQKHRNVLLHLVGDKDENTELPEGVIHHGFLKKNNPQQLTRLQELFRQSHLLILPTRFDCTPVTICEASMYGIPTLVTRTGGVEGHLKEGINGYLIPYEDKGALWSDKIIELMENPGEYLKLRKKSRDIYERELNWQKYAEKMREIMEFALKKTIP